MYIGRASRYGSNRLRLCCIIFRSEKAEGAQPIQQAHHIHTCIGVDGPTESVRIYTSGKGKRNSVALVIECRSKPKQFVFDGRTEWLGWRRNPHQRPDNFALLSARQRALHRAAATRSRRSPMWNLIRYDETFFFFGFFFRVSFCRCRRHPHPCSMARQN